MILVQHQNQGLHRSCPRQRILRRNGTPGARSSARARRRPPCTAWTCLPGSTSWPGTRCTKTGPRCRRSQGCTRSLPTSWTWLERSRSAGTYQSIRQSKTPRPRTASRGFPKRRCPRNPGGTRTGTRWWRPRGRWSWQGTTGWRCWSHWPPGTRRPCSRASSPGWSGWRPPAPSAWPASGSGGRQSTRRPSRP